MIEIYCRQIYNSLSLPNYSPKISNVKDNNVTQTKGSLKRKHEKETGYFIVVPTSLPSAAKSRFSGLNPLKTTNFT